MTDIFQIGQLIGITFFCISISFAVIALIFAFKIKMYNQFSTEILIYVLIAEIVFDLTKFLAFLRSSTLSQTKKDILLSFELFFMICPELFSNLAILIHTIKIYDALIRESQWFIISKVKIISRIVLVLFPFIHSLVCIFLQLYHYGSTSDKCLNPLFCSFDSPLLLYSQIADLICIILILCFIVYSFSFLQWTLRNNKHYSIKTKSKIKSASCKVWLYPLMATLYWILRLFAANLIMAISNVNIYLFPLVLVSLRGSVFALLFIFTQDSLLNVICDHLFFCLRRERKLSVYDDTGRENETNEIIGNAVEEIEFTLL